MAEKTDSAQPSHSRIHIGLACCNSFLKTRKEILFQSSEVTTVSCTELHTSLLLGLIFKNHRNKDVNLDIKEC